MCMYVVLFFSPAAIFNNSKKVASLSRIVLYVSARRRNATNYGFRASLFLCQL